MIAFAAERLMEMEVGAKAGARASRTICRPPGSARRLPGPRRGDARGDGGVAHSKIANWHLPNDEAIVRLVGAILLEQNDEWAVQRARYMTLETLAALSDDAVVGFPAAAI